MFLLIQQDCPQSQQADRGGWLEQLEDQVRQREGGGVPHHDEVEERVEVVEGGCRHVLKPEGNVCGQMRGVRHSGWDSMFMFFVVVLT